MSDARNWRVSPAQSLAAAALQGIVLTAARRQEVEALAGRYRSAATLVRLKPRPPVRNGWAAAGTMTKTHCKELGNRSAEKTKTL